MGGGETTEKSAWIYTCKKPGMLCCFFLLFQKYQLILFFYFTFTTVTILAFSTPLNFEAGFCSTWWRSNQIFHICCKRKTIYKPRMECNVPPIVHPIFPAFCISQYSVPCLYMYLKYNMFKIQYISKQKPLKILS